MRLKSETVAGAVFLVAFALNLSAAVFAQSATADSGKGTIRPVSEISAKDWGLLAGALSREDWSASIKLSSEYIRRLGTDNEKKQLAQLRYLHLFSLAGQLNSFIVGKNAPAIEPARQRLDEAATRFYLREIVMPPRASAPVCTGKVNFICPVRENTKALRVSATNKDGDAILSFDYVLFEDAVKFYDFEGKKAFLGGVLDRAEFNPDPSKPWVMRLFLKKGFARISVGD